MSDVQKSLAILIKTATELKGAEEAVELLEKNIGKAKALGKEYGALEEQLKSAKAAISDYNQALEQNNSDLGDSAKKVEFLNYKKSELKKLVKDLSHEFPELGRVMKLALDPRILGVTLLIKAFGSLREQIANTVTLLAPSEWQGRAAAIQAGAKALEDSAIAAARFNDELNQNVTATDKIRQNSEAAVAAIHAQATAEAEKRNAMQGAEMAGIDAAEKAGLISPEAAIVRRAGVKEKYEKLEAAAKELEANRAINAALQERTQLLEHIREMESKLPELQEKSAQAESRQAILDQERGIHADNIAKSNAKIAEYD